MKLLELLKRTYKMIEVNNITTNEIDKNFLRGIAEIVLKGENKEKDDLSVVLIGSSKMRGLNKKYRGKNKVTDVLSFGKSFEKFPKIVKNELGEVVICIQEIKKAVRRFGLNYNKELARVLIHGILHLVGYEHERGEEQAKEMEKRQEYYLSKINFEF